MVSPPLSRLGIIWYSVLPQGDYAMVVCRSYDTAGSLVFISDPLAIQTHWQNTDPLAKSRPTGKIYTLWLGKKVVHIVTRNIKKIKSCFHQYFIYIHKFNKTRHKKKTVWLACAWGRTPLVVTPAASFSSSSHCNCYPIHCYELEQSQ